MRWRTLHRSMLGQMLILTALFSAWGFYSIAILPWSGSPPVAPTPAIDLTGTKVRDAFSMFLFESSGKTDRPTPIDANPVIREVLARNPAFRYQIRIDDRVYGNASQARFYESLGFARFTRMSKGMGAYRPCSLLQRDLTVGRDHRYISYSNCERLTYYEYSGLTTPIDVSDLANATPETKWMMGYIVTFLKTVGALVLLFALVLVVNMVMIRRVAKLAGSFDPERIDDTLPERGLPVEVVPLVRAVNTMVTRVRDARAQQAFFLSAAAHEMRTPLTVLRTRLELLDDGAAKDRLVKDVRRMTRLVNQLLMLMGVQAREVNHEPFDLATCIHRAIAAREPVATDRGVRIRFVADPAAASPSIPGDAALFEVAVANLIENAVTVSPAGEEVVVTLDADGTVTVRDHGPGVPEEQRPMLFQPFVRFSSHRGGHGLGLAITRAIVTRHGGDVTVANADDGGAVFTIRPDGTTTNGVAVRPDR